jgi:Protein of unknown function (DUF3667)
VHSENPESTVQSRGPQVHGAFCHNCGIRLAGRYCAACGQKAVPLSVTLHEFFHELIHETLHVDGRIFQSIRRLLLSPGFLTREYLQGRRARWISPIRLYLVFSVIFFALSAPGGPGPMRLRIAGTRGETQAEALQKLGYEDEDELRQETNRALLRWAPRVMFVLLPFFAWLVAIAYRGVDRNYLHHLIFALHLHAAWFGVGACAAAVEIASPRIGDAAQTLALAYVPVYAIVTFRKVYGRVRFAVGRQAFVFGIYSVTVMAALLGIVLPVVFRAYWD